MRRQTLEHVVHQTVVPRLLRGHEVVAVGIPFDLFQRLPGAVLQDLLHQALVRSRCLVRISISAASPAPPSYLMNHHLGTRQGVALPAVPTASRVMPMPAAMPMQQAATSQARVVHGTVDRHPPVADPPGQSDVQVDVRAGILESR